MNVPTPLNDTARDDRFNRGLQRLLDGDPAGIEEIDPDLRDVAIQMVRLANNAGWVDADPATTLPGKRWWQDTRRVINTLAAVLVIGLIGVMIAVGARIWNQPGDQYAGVSSPAVGVGPGVCRRLARSDADIAAIVRLSEAEVQPFQEVGADGETFDTVTTGIQTARDWNSCLQTRQWKRAMAYESEYFIWKLGQDQFPNGAASLTDADIAAQISERHAQIQPIPTTNNANLRFYAIENMRTEWDNETYRVTGMDVWIVPMDPQGEWLEWPTVFTYEWDGTQIVIVSTTQDGVPASEYRRSETIPAPATATPGVDSE